MPPWLENTLLFSVDQFFALYPQSRPSTEQLDSCKIVSHRGERDNQLVFENTFAAFDPILENNIWGIEFDIRWSQDLVPFVIHDTDGKRLFNKAISIANSNSAEIIKTLPLVPTLESFISRYGGRAHLMAELKEEFYPKPDYQQAVLKDLFSSLQPAQDFHFISLNCDMFDYVSFVPDKALLPVSTINAASFSQFALDKKLGGLSGHYLLVSQAMVEQHHKQGQKVGTGFVNSQNALFREINRGSDWIFSNEALKLKSIISQH